MMLNPIKKLNLIKGFKLSSILIFLFFSLSFPALGAIEFVESQQQIPNGNSRDVKFADLDNDGDLDIVVAVFSGRDIVLRNEGGELLLVQYVSTHHQSQGVQLADMNNDGYIDYVVGGNGAIEIKFNNGSGIFGPESQSISVNNPSMDLDIADFNGDGYLDIISAQANDNAVFANLILMQENGSFTESNVVTLSDRVDSSFGVEAADLNNDGYPDAIFANHYEQQNVVRLNDGHGNLVVSQTIPDSTTIDIALADFDGDGDLDLYEPRVHAPDTVWFNDGEGHFTDSGQLLGNYGGCVASVGDLDSDGDQDVIVSSCSADEQNVVWVNDGSGVFAESEFTFGSGRSIASALGDVDGDGDLDLYVAKFSPGIDSLWINGTDPVAQVDIDEIIEETVSLCQEDPEACGIVDENGSTEEGILQCVNDPNSHGLYGQSDIDQARYEGELAGIDQGIAQCISDPASFGLFDEASLQQATVESFDSGYQDGRQSCIDNPSDCGLFTQADLNAGAQQEKDDVVALIASQMTRGQLISVCRKHSDSPLCDHVSMPNHQWNWRDKLIALSQAACRWLGCEDKIKRYAR